MRRIFLLSAFLLVPLFSPAADSTGIDVGQAKVYDNRSLTLMLDTLNDQLRQVQVVNQPTLAAALGMLQGFQTQEVIRAGSFQAAIPYMQPATPAAQQQTGSTSAQSAPTQVIPALPGVPWDMNTQFSALTPSSENKYGLGAGDLLGDQVSLTYQIFNIRMLLDRSLTDRLQVHEPKLQAVLGFNVTLDPPRDAVGSAAIVEVTVNLKGSKRGVSVVSLLPQEKTYNSAALSTKTNSFGGSAAAKLITVGYSERRRGQTYYLFRDNDTVAFERTTRSGEPVKFGWQFRPVLGRQSVAPGLRQMFAVVSLDDSDLPSEVEGEAELEVTVETHWRKYDRGSLTTAEKGQIPWWNKLAYVAGLGVPFVYAPSGTRKDCYSVPVPKTSRYQNDLRPKVTDVAWTWVGKKDMLVRIVGENFFRDTKVAVGGKIVDSPPALTIKSDQAMDLLMDAASVTDAAILGRYGPAITLRDKSQGWRLGIQDVPVSTAIGGQRWVDVILGKNCVEQICQPLTIAELPSASPQMMLLKMRETDPSPNREKVSSLRTLALQEAPAFTLTPVITLNGNPIPGPWLLSEYKRPPTAADPGGSRVLARALVSTDVMKEPDGLITIIYPFKGPELTASFRINDANKDFEIQRVHDDPKNAMVLLVAKVPKELGWNTPDTRWRVLLSDGQEAELKACDARPIADSQTAQPGAQSTSPAQQSNIGRAQRGRRAQRTAQQQENAAQRPPAITAPPDLFCKESGDIAVLRTGNLPNGDTLVLRQLKTDGTTAATYAVAIPKKKDEKPVEKPLPSVNQYDSRWVALDTEGFKDFDTVEIDGRNFDKNRELIMETKDEKISKIEVYLSRAITAKPGTIEITFRDTKGAPVNRSKVVVKCVECEMKEAKKQ